MSKKVKKAVDDKEEVQVHIPKEEWHRLARMLGGCHSIFEKMWKMGKPIFDPSIETACVQFDKTGEFIVWKFNPKFWKSLDTYTKAFVISHEALHIILNHGLRSKDAYNHEAANIAMDLVDNHMLVSGFGFKRKRINGYKNLCWVETIFKHMAKKPSKHLTFEAYYNLFPKKLGKCKGKKDGEGEGEGGEGDPNSMGGMSNGEHTVDDHRGFAKSDFNKVLEKLADQLSDEELQEVLDIIEEKVEQTNKYQRAGTGTGGLWYRSGARAVKKRKWETVITKWSKKYLKEADRDHEQWARLNRRLACMPQGMFLPSDMEVDDDYEKTRIPVRFYLDTSGSCWDLKDRFFAAALSLPKDRFDLRLFCFDTTVVETSLESGKIYGGGGTRFDIIERSIQQDMLKNNIKYPEAVFVITDGMGNHIRIDPKMEKRWFWFISEGKYYMENYAKHYVPKGCNFFSLEDFE